MANQKKFYKMLHIIEEHRKKIATMSEKEQVFENIQYDTNKYCVGERTHVFSKKRIWYRESFTNTGERWNSL